MTVFDAFILELVQDGRESFRPTLGQFSMMKKPGKAIKRAEETQAWLILDWLGRGIVFAWLERAGYAVQMERLRGIRAINRDTAHVALDVLEAFDEETLMPVAMAGRATDINEETNRVVDLAGWSGVWAAQGFHINAAVQGTEAAQLYSKVSGTASRVVMSAIRAVTREGRTTAVEDKTLATIERIERSIKPLVDRLLAVS